LDFWKDLRRHRVGAERARPVAAKDIARLPQEQRQESGNERRAAPDLFHELTMGEHAPRVPRQTDEEAVLDRREVERLIADAGLMAPEIQDQAAGLVYTFSQNDMASAAVVRAR